MYTVINQQVLHLAYELPEDGTDVPIHADVVGCSGRPYF